MNKICFYSISTQLGGAERSLLEYIRHAAADKEVTAELLVPKESGPLLEEARKAGVEIKVLPMPLSLLSLSRQSPYGLVKSLLTLDAIRYLVRLILYFRATRPGVVYTTGIKCHLFAGYASIFSGTSVLWHLRDHFSGKATRLLLRSALLASRRTSAVANSAATALSLGNDLHIPVIYNGVSAGDFPYQRSSHLRTALGIGNDAKLVGIVGVLARWKGQEEFLRMAADLATRRPDLHFVVIGDQIYDTSGDSGYRRKLVALSERLGLSGRVHFTGFVRDTANYLASLDVLVHASIKPEPFGRVIIEAMACGTPLTASAAGGPLEIILPGSNGLLHPPGDVKRMAENVERLLDPHFASLLRQKAHADFQSRFTSATYNGKLHATIKSYLPSASSRSDIVSATGP